MTGVVGRALWLALLAAAAACTARAAEDLTPLGVPGTRGGVVATSEAHAAHAGARILAEGGNAIDAAVAVHLVLNVVEPQSAGIGGGGFMLLHLARENRTIAIDSREKAPAAATPDLFVSEDGTAFEFSAASTSGVAVGVPGTIKGLLTALERWGSMSRERVFEPAIELAEQGFRVGPQLAANVLSERLANEPGDPAYEEARKVFHPNGVPLTSGELLRQPQLARTLRAVAARGAAAFYSGEIAQAIVHAQRHARSVEPAADRLRLQGRMTLEDLAGYEVSLREPVVGEYRGYTIKSMGPPSSGGLTVLQILALLERFPIGDAVHDYGFGAPRTLHVMVEAMRLAFADRALWMGDADFVPVPGTGLLHRGYIRERSALIDPQRRSDAIIAGDPRRFEADGSDARHERLAQRDTSLTDGRNTTHFSIADRYGNLVSYTSSIESAWGTGLMVPGFGFLLNNELTDFNFVPRRDTDPEHFDPGANDVAANKRPRSSMAPTIAFKSGRPVAAYGSPGGSTIIHSVVNTTLNLIDHGFDAQQAVDAPRISQTSVDGALSWEAGLPEPSMRALAELGHRLRDPAPIGSVQMVVIDPRNGRQYGAADRRRVGAVATAPAPAAREAAQPAQ